MEEVLSIVLLTSCCLENLQVLLHVDNSDIVPLWTCFPVIEFHSCFVIPFTIVCVSVSLAQILFFQASVRIFVEVK